MKISKTTYWKRSLPVFVVTFLLINVALMRATPKNSIEPVYAVSEQSSALYRSSPTAHVITDIDVTDPEKAYDNDETTYASFTYTQADGSFELNSFTALSDPWRIVQVDFNMNYSTTISSSDDKYRILYYVNPSTTPVVLKDWKRDAVSLKESWFNRPEPNDGVWDWTDLSNIRFVIETDRTGGADSGGDFKAYEIWATVTYRNPTVHVDPPSIETTEPFSVYINITNMDDLYSWELNVTYDTAVLTATDVAEGSFLSSGGSTYFNKTINDAEGWVYAYCTLQGDVPGVTGNGILATISFSPDAGGESVLDLHDTKLVEYDYVSKQTYLYPPYYIGEVDGYVKITLAVPTGSIAGTVTDTSTELPIAGASVTAVGPETRSTTTAADGTYLLADVLTGDYTVTASATGYHDQTKPATVTEGVTTTVDFALELIPTVGWINGTVTDADTLDPIAGATVEADGNFDTTDATGYYEIEIAPGDYTVTVSMTEYVTQSKPAHVDAGATTTVDFALEPVTHTLEVISEPISGIDFTLDGVVYTTPWSDSLREGTYTIEMPSTWDVYNFDHWEEMSTDPTRVVDLTSDMTVTAYYVKRQWTLTVNSNPIDDVDFTLDGATYTTPWSSLLDEGSYTVEMPMTWTTATGDVYQFDHWEDASTNPSRTVSLTSDTSITAYYEYVPKTYMLTVNCDPITGVEFTIDGATQSTPWTGDLGEGSHTIVMPSSWTVDTDVYNFDHWEDMSTNPSRTISLTEDMTVTAYYVLMPPTYWTLTVDSEPITGVEFTLDGVSQTTPYLESLIEGSHTIVMPSAWGIYDFDHWEDMSTDLTRVVGLTSDMSVTAYYVKRQWTLNVNSDPISGVEFTLDGPTYVTPWSGLLDEGSYTVVMPSTWFVGAEEYRFVQWEDMSTDPTRTVSLTTDTTITAYYEYVPKEFTLTVNSLPIDGIDFTINDVTHTTNWTSLLQEGAYTIVMPTMWTTPGGDTYQFDHWEDDSTDPTRVIELTGDMTPTAYYEYAPVTHKLTVNSDPIADVEFTIDGVTHTTPWTGDLAEGSYTIEMPSTWGVYNFYHWEDMSTNPTRTISLTADVTVTAYYVLAPKYWTLTVNSDAMDGVEFTVDGVTHITPWSDTFVEGTYTIVMPSTWTVDTDEYVFDHWEDASTDPTRTISLASEVSITAYYVLAPKYWTLTVSSEPISGIEFTIDSAVHTTPWADSLLEGTYIIVMPLEWIVDTDVYNFDHWEDGSTNPTRTISLTEDIAITATYELYVPVYGWIDGYVTDTETGDALAGATVTANGVSVLTNAEGYYNIEVTPGTYTVTASMVGYESQSKSVTVSAGETITVDFALSPTPFTIDSLIAEVEEFYNLGYIDEEDIKDSLMDKLLAAKAKINAGQIHVAKNILRAFMNHVRAQLGKHITVEAADILLTDAQYIIDNL